MDPKESPNNIINTLASGGVLRIAASGLTAVVDPDRADASLQPQCL
jgi:hypothetical protein